MKKGFTLVELLAVIVILAIISLIAIPIVIDMINNSKEKSNREGLNLYIDTVSKRIANNNLDVLYSPDMCIIQSTGDLLCLKNDEELYVDEEKTNKILEIKMNGKKSSEGTLYFTNGKITTGENIKYGDLYYTITNGVISKGSTEKNDITVAVMSKIKNAVGNYTGTCEIENKTTIKCGDDIKNIQQSGHKAEEGLITFENSDIKSYSNIKIEGRYYHQSRSGKKSESTEEKYGILISKNGAKEYNLGDKYTYKVNDSDIFNFYVLTEPEDGKINLIMDRNICNDGTVNYTSDNNYCSCSWTPNNANNYGPDSSMTYLYEGTKNWTNVFDMMMNYIDENNTNSETEGYTSIITDEETKITTITPKQNRISNRQKFGNLNEPLKARLPKEKELKDAGCKTNDGSCPVWLMENMTYYNVSNDKYSINNNTEVYQNQIKGYWGLASYPYYGTNGRSVTYTGKLFQSGLGYGVRPVITVSTNDLLDLIN